MNDNELLDVLLYLPGMPPRKLPAMASTTTGQLLQSAGAGADLLVFSPDGREAVRPPLKPTTPGEPSTSTWFSESPGRISILSKWVVFLAPLILYAHRQPLAR